MASSQPSQPSIDQAYEAPGNPTDQEPVEKRRAQQTAQSEPITHRSSAPQASYSDATPTSMARGIHGAPPGYETQGHTQSSLDSQELDAEQMGAPGEGKVASAVDRHPGASGAERGLETDLDRKKAEQAPARAREQEEEQKNFDVGGVLGQRGGVANPVDKDGYPNSGSS